MIGIWLVVSSSGCPLLIREAQLEGKARSTAPFYSNPAHCGDRFATVDSGFVPTNARAQTRSRSCSESCRASGNIVVSHCWRFNKRRPQKCLPRREHSEFEKFKQPCTQANRVDEFDPSALITKMNDAAGFNATHRGASNSTLLRLPMPFLRLGVGVVNPTVHNIGFARFDLYTPERECFRGVEFGPMDLLELMIWIRERHLERCKIEI